MKRAPAPNQGREGGGRKGGKRGRKERRRKTEKKRKGGPASGRSVTRRRGESRLADGGRVCGEGGWQSIDARAICAAKFWAELNDNGGGLAGMAEQLSKPDAGTSNCACAPRLRHRSKSSRAGKGFGECKKAKPARLIVALVLAVEGRRE